MNEPTVDSVSFFERLASEMNAHPEEYEILGDVEMRVAIVMTQPDTPPFAVALEFEGIECSAVEAIGPGEEHDADCWLEGALADWQTMFADIVAHGQAEGRQTINSLTMLADRISAHGDDPLGLDRFFRFNQTVQNFFDGAARAAVAA